MSERIVVGIDGSDHARRALQYAFAEARRRDARVDVVHAYVLPRPWGASEFFEPGLDDARLEAERLANRVVDRMVATPPADLKVERIVACGPAAATLLQVARGADLLVVGSRGRGGFRGLLLGSTSHQVITHAPCPVVVVQPGEPAEASRPAA